MLTGVGAIGILAPRTCSRLFGVPAGDRDTLVYVRAVGARDAIFAAVVWAALDQPALLRRVLGAVSLIGVADACAIAASHGPRPQHVLHLGGFAVVAWIALSIDE